MEIGVRKSDVTDRSIGSTVHDSAGSSVLAVSASVKVPSPSVVAHTWWKFGYWYVVASVQTPFSSRSTRTADGSANVSLPQLKQVVIPTWNVADVCSVYVRVGRPELYPGGKSYDSVPNASMSVVLPAVVTL